MTNWMFSLLHASKVSAIAALTFQNLKQMTIEESASRGLLATARLLFSYALTKCVKPAVKTENFLLFTT